MTLRVSSATGEVVLTLPERTPLEEARRFAGAHGGWIDARLARVPERVAFENGAVVPLRGVPHRIVHWSTGPGALGPDRDEAGEPILAVSGDERRLPRRVRQFLEREAQRDLAEAVERHSAALGIPTPKLTIRDTRTRWGSCSGTGRLNFSWRLILAPPFVLDYLAAHEVAHLKEMNHSHRFWRVTHSLCPRTEEAERWLKRRGANLHRYG
jgi:predicted metal-dependent hydrolase